MISKSLPPPTEADNDRYEAMKLLGCIACHLDRGDYEVWVYPDIHHYTRANKRISHAMSVPLCKNHHTGTGSKAVSWHFAKAKFRGMYGRDADLVSLVNERIDRL